MGETTPTVFITFLTIIVHVSLLLTNSAAAVNPNGFTLRMIHKDSKESPFYNPDDIRFTQEERFQTLIDQSKSRSRYIASQILLHDNNTTMVPDVVRPPVVYESSGWYVGLVGIGTFLNIQQSFLNYYLMVDSGSDLTWLQCKGAVKTFNQDFANWPLYPWADSQTYRPLSCRNNPVCTGQRCNLKGECTYRVTYASSAVTMGVVAEETFNIHSNTGGGLETLKLIMGCGFRQENFDFGNNRLRRGMPDLIAGILGLGRGPRSFLSQLGAAGQGKFSYCLEMYNKDIHAGNTYLSFGADAIIRGVARTTPIFTPHFPTSYYYLILQGISVGRTSAGFSREDFEVKQDGRGGCVIDSGAPFTMMYKDHFDRLAESVVEYFQRVYGMPRIGYTGDRVCFVVPQEIKKFKPPTITFHFQQANYVVSETSALFVLDGELLCLAIGRSDIDTPALILGALQQVNKRILYNTMDLSLSFADENCQIGL